MALPYDLVESLSIWYIPDKGIVMFP